MTRSRADQRPVAGEREAVAGGDPQQRHERGRGEALRHGGQKILLAHHAGVEQRQPRNGHHQDESRGGDHPGGVGRVDLSQGVLRRRRRGEQDHQSAGARQRPAREAQPHEEPSRWISPAFKLTVLRACASFLGEETALSGRVLPNFAAKASDN